MFGKWWGVFVGETSVWCDAEDYGWGCVLIYSGFWIAHWGCADKLIRQLTRPTTNNVIIEI